MKLVLCVPKVHLMIFKQPLVILFVKKLNIIKMVIATASKTFIVLNLDYV